VTDLGRGRDGDGHALWSVEGPEFQLLLIATPACSTSALDRDNPPFLACEDALEVAIKAFAVGR
jgi:hypothetical protein